MDRGIAGSTATLTLGAPLLSLLLPAVAAAQTFTLRDYAGRTWAPDLVQYEIKAKPAELARLRLTDGDGKPVAIQFSPAARKDRTLLSFVTGLPADGTVSFTLTREAQAGAPAAPATGVSVTGDGDTLVLASGAVAVRVPAPGEKRFTTPVPAATLPAPILAFRGAGMDAWLGAGRVLSQRPVQGWRVQQTAAGPVFAEVVCQLDYAGGGYYRATVRVTDQVPMAHVTEEYDLGRMADAEGFWELDLTQGWAPDTVESARCWGNGGVDAGRSQPLGEFAAKEIMAGNNFHGDSVSFLGLISAAQAKAAPAAVTRVGVVPLRRGQWRRASATLPLERPAPGQLRVRFPMVRTPPLWMETSPFCVALHEDALPATYARRVWGLLLGAPPVALKGGNRGDAVVTPTYQARVTYGSIPLDRYKDFILEWPDDGRTRYPRAFIREAELPAIRTALEGNAWAAPLKSAYGLCGADPKTFQQNLVRARQQLRGLCALALYSPAPSHHGTCDAQTGIAQADDVLAAADTSPEVRRELRTLLALTAYLYTDPDTTGHGVGDHTGNPNMSMARQLWLTPLIAMLPDHPMFTAWRDYQTAFQSFKFADNMAPGGGWFEPGTYHQWAYARVCYSMFGMDTMKVQGLEQLFAYHDADLDYYLNLLTPVDSRYGARMVPGFGNSATHYAAEFLEGAGSVAAHNPALAERLLWGWTVNGRQRVHTPAVIKPWLTAREPALTSRQVPGFGVIFRAHQGPDETYLLLRSGYLWSHWTVDQGNVILYSKGAALLPAQPYTYFDSTLREHSQYNDIRFGHPANEFRFAWPDSNVLDCHFGRQVQYAWASAGYPAWFITPGVTPGFGEPPRLQAGLAQSEGEFWWNRQVAFLIGRTPRSPNYFVFHDTITGPGRLAQWFNLDVTGGPDVLAAAGNRLSVRTEWPVSLDLMFADERVLKPELTEEQQFLNLHASVYGPTWNAATAGQPVSPHWSRKDGKPVTRDPLQVPDQERRQLVRIPAAPGQDHLWIAVPRGAGEAAPTVARLAPAAVKVTHAEGTDYVLLAPEPAQFAGQDVVLAGQGAAVRVGAESVTLAVMGGAGRAGYRGHVLEGVGPFEETIPLDRLKPGVRTPRGPGAASLPCRPGLRGHQVVADGVTRAAKGDFVEYVVNAPAGPVTFAADGVQIHARRALLQVRPGATRIVCGDATFAQIAAGTRGVRGLGPFDLTLSDTAITGHVDGRQRTLVASTPRNLVKPMYHLDGVRWYAAYPDDPAPYRGCSDCQFSLAFAFGDGPHQIEVGAWTSPPMPPVPARREL